MTDGGSLDHQIVVNGVTLAVEEFGRRDDRTIVLVAGGASSRDWWDEGLCRRLATGDASGGRRVIRYDFRDTGRSTTVPPGEAAYRASDLVDDLAALIEATDAVPAHVVGLSMGGGLTQELALARPELFATMTLMSTTAARSLAAYGDLPPSEPRVTEAFGAGDDGPDWTDPAAVGDHMVTVERLLGGTIPVDEERVRGIAAAVVARSVDPASADNHWMIEEGPVSPGELSEITIPTLVLHGSLDPLFPLPHAEALAAVIPGARLVVIPGMGHQFPPPETWDLIVPELLRHTASAGLTPHGP
jgi:pimeloyl-ACP methyl ester carboxylesterase